jgi:crossover junction endodeoxyribonuclease RusA
MEENKIDMEVTKLQTIVIPFPPSVNTYYRTFQGRMIISAAGRAYRQAVISKAQTDEPLLGRLSVEVEVFPPDRRRRDLDNVCKAALDSLQHAGIYQDDSQIDQLLLKRREVTPGGFLKVHISTI